MKGGMITRINNELKAIEENFSIEELFLKHGIISLMFYEPLEFQQLIIKINMERDKHSDTQSRLMFITLYKKVYLAQRKKLLELFDAVKNRTTKIDFLYLLILVFVFRRKQVRSALKNKSILCYNINIVEIINQKENGDAAVT